MLYPPILTNTQPVFDISNTFTISYSLADVTALDDFNCIDLVIAQASNNTSILKNGQKIFRGGVNTARSGVLQVTTADFKSGMFIAGNLYKVQLRLVKEASPEVRNINTDSFSEWSTVMIIKPINKPEIAISSEGITLNENNIIIPSLTPTFHGVCSILSSDKEFEEQFRFTIYQGERLVLDSGWLAHEAGSQNDSWYCNSMLTQRGAYNLVYEIKTVNGYYMSTPLPSESAVYSFVATQSTSGDLSILFRAEQDSNLGCINLNIFKDPNSEISSLIGTYIITRSSEKTNFQLFEDIKFLNYAFRPISTTEPLLALQDFTVESGITYQYAIQQLLPGNYRTNLLKTSKLLINLEYSYLYRDEVQLRLALNQNVSNFKHTVLRNKQDTLGGKYPYLSQNGNAYYTEFSLSGLISYQDNISSFFKFQANDGVYYKDELIIPVSKFDENRSSMVKRSANEQSVQPQNIFNHKTGYEFGSAENDQYYAYHNDLVATSDRRSSEDHPVGSSNDSSNSDVVNADGSISYNLIDNNIYIERRFREKVEEFLNSFNCKLYRSSTEGNIVITLMNVVLKPIESLGRMLYEFSATACEVLDPTLSEMDKCGIISIGESQELSEIFNTIYSFGQIEISTTNIPDNTTSAVNILDLIKSQERRDIDEINEYVVNKLKWLWIESKDLYKSQTLMRTINLNGASYITPTQKPFTIMIPSSTQEALEISADEVRTNNAFYINYICDLKPQVKKDISIIREPPQLILDFDQILWYGTGREEDYIDLLQAIKDHVMIANGIIENSEGVWTNSDGSIEYRFDHIKFIDITTQKNTLIQIGTSSEDYQEFKIGWHKPAANSSNQSDWVENTFNSNRLIFPLLDQDGDAHAKFLQIAGASQALITFTYYIEKTIVSYVEESDETNP